MVTFARASLALLMAGMLFGDIVVASIGLIGVCAAATYRECRSAAPQLATAARLDA